MFHFKEAMRSAARKYNSENRPNWISICSVPRTRETLIVRIECQLLSDIGWTTSILILHRKWPIRQNGWAVGNRYRYKPLYWCVYVCVSMRCVAPFDRMMMERFGWENERKSRNWISSKSKSFCFISRRKSNNALLMRAFQRLRGMWPNHRSIYKAPNQHVDTELKHNLFNQIACCSCVCCFNAAVLLNFEIILTQIICIISIRRRLSDWRWLWGKSGDWELMQRTTVGGWARRLDWVLGFGVVVNRVW